MSAIHVKDLYKQFKVQKNREGLKGALQDLFKREYRHITAVDHISFDIPAGEICGYIGENGAGKSTTIKMLTGILVPTSGELVVNGYVPYKEREKFVRGIGVVFGQRSQLWWDIGVIESFQLLRKVYRVELNDFRQRLDELVERLQLQELLHRPVRKLSLGQRMRCELAASLLHNPSILFLDEPTIGLDIVVKTEIRQFLKQLNQKHGTTILLTTHDLQDIEALCSRVIMLDEGRIIYDGGLEELKNRWGKGKEVVFRFNKPYNIQQLEAMTAGLQVKWTIESTIAAASTSDVKMPSVTATADAANGTTAQGMITTADKENSAKMPSVTATADAANGTPVPGTTTMADAANSGEMSASVAVPATGGVGSASVIAKIWVPAEHTSISEVLGRVVGAASVEDVKIIETQTDDIVREIYKTGSSYTSSIIIESGSGDGKNVHDINQKGEGDTQKDDTQKDDIQKSENQKNENQKNDNQKNDNQKRENQKKDNQKDDNQKDKEPLGAGRGSASS